MEERVRNDECFRCKARGHRANNCPSKPNWPAKQCPCGVGPCDVRISHTPENPNRDYYRCPARKADNCKFFEWCDWANIDKPIYRCGAGKCSLLTVKKEGKNKGRKFFACPIKPGEGKNCGFNEWLDDILKKVNYEDFETAWLHLDSFDQEMEVKRVKNDECFKCKAQGHWAIDCPSTPKWPARQCPCVVRTSRTQKHPNRDFFVCPAKKADQCNFFEWCDQANIDERQELPQVPYPICPCGAGKCSFLTVKKEGVNKGRKFFVCPIERGHGACGFFQWLDDSRQETEARNVDQTDVDSLLSNMRKLKVTSPMELDQCYRCGVQGHWARDCLKPAY